MPTAVRYKSRTGDSIPTCLPIFFFFILLGNIYALTGLARRNYCVLFSKAASCCAAVYVCSRVRSCRGGGMNRRRFWRKQTKKKALRTAHCSCRYLNIKRFWVRVVQHGLKKKALVSYVPYFEGLPCPLPPLPFLGRRTHVYSSHKSSGPSVCAGQHVVLRT